MPKLIKHRTIVQDDWTLLREANSIEEISQAGKQIIISLTHWKQFQDELTSFAGKIGIWLESSQSPKEIIADVNNFEVIALDFPVFSDGRAYSYARELRNDLEYAGELRAIGDVLRDQLYYMSSCGFDAFDLRDDQDAPSAITAFDDFKEAYQASVKQPIPLFRRR